MSMIFFFLMPESHPSETNESEVFSYLSIFRTDFFVFLYFFPKRKNL
jgi:hypothetical protein